MKNQSQSAPPNGTPQKASSLLLTVNRPNSPSKLIPTLAITLLAATLSAPGLTFRVPSPDHNRFVGNTPNPDFIHAAVDLTGVGYRNAGEQRSVTLVSPQHVVYARHFSLAAGSPLRFIAADGSIVDRTIASNSTILNDDGQPTDLLLGLLSSPISENTGIRSQTYLNNPGDVSDELFYDPPKNLAASPNPNTQLIVLGQARQGGRGLTTLRAPFYNTETTAVRGFNAAETLQFDYFVDGDPNSSAREPSVTDSDAFVVSGDSGSPTLVNINGRGSILGVHGVRLRGNAGSFEIVRTIDIFVPHQPYIDQLNAQLSLRGFHMTKAFPETTTLSLQITQPTTTIRAGVPSDLSFLVTNTGAETANNLLVQHEISPGTSTALTAPDWFEIPQATQFEARRADLNPREKSPFTTTIRFSTPGNFSIPVTIRSDESSTSVQDLNVLVLPSFINYAEGLSNSTATGDDDADGISNLEEYAFGGNITENSQHLPDGVTSLRPQASQPSADGTVTYSFLRRTDAVDRALTYTVQESSSLDGSDWTNVTLAGETTTPLSDDIESVEATFSPRNEENFYRLRIDLDE